MQQRTISAVYFKLGVGKYGVSQAYYFFSNGLFYQGYDADNQRFIVYTMPGLFQDIVEYDVRHNHPLDWGVYKFIGDTLVTEMLLDNRTTRFDTYGPLLHREYKISDGQIMLVKTVYATKKIWQTPKITVYRTCKIL